MQFITRGHDVFDAVVVGSGLDGSFTDGLVDKLSRLKRSGGKGRAFRLRRIASGESECRLARASGIREFQVA